eukprot:9516563-Ditylum_brightwellii.AAC.1
MIECTTAIGYALDFIGGNGGKVEILGTNLCILHTLLLCCALFLNRHRTISQGLQQCTGPQMAGGAGRLGANT